MQKFSVTPIGTCRLNNPLRQAQGRYPIALNTRRIYGYTHTSDEALQQLRYMQGDKTFSTRAKPVVMRPESGHDCDAEIWQPSDLTIVEISSAKKITSGEDSLQINYLYRHFADFFASKDRTLHFWSLVKRGSRADLLEYLRSERTYCMLKPEDRALLASVQMEHQDFAAIKSDMAEIAERLGGSRLLFMTHVNGCTPDGSTIAARERLIQWVRLAAEQLGKPCFDPTAAMREFGQERALEHEGLDLTHFTPAFSNRVFGEIHREHIAPLMEAQGDSDEEQDRLVRQHLFADNIDALIRFDDFTAGTRRLFAALRKEPDAVPLLQLRGRILADIGDFEGAVRDLDAIERSSGLSPAARVALLEACSETSDWPRVLELANGLLGEEFESRKIFACAARAHEAMGDLEGAASQWKQAFRQDRTDLNAALRALALLTELGQAEQLKTWRDEVLEHSRSSTNGAFEIARWALDHGDEELLAKTFGAVCELDPGLAETLFSGALSAGMVKAATGCLAHLPRSDDRPVVQFREKLAALGGKTAADLLDRDLHVAAFELASASAAIKASGPAVRTRRRALSWFRTEIRGAYAAGDYAGVVEKWSQAAVLGADAADTALVVALALQKLDRLEESLELLLRILDSTPDDSATLRRAGRVAAVLGRYEVALPAYAKLRRSDDATAEKYRPETDKFFATAERRAFKQLRAAIVEARFEEALDLAEILQPELEDPEQLDREIGRLDRLLRIRLREIEQGASDEADRERMLSLLLRMNPSDPVILRRAALNAMRTMQFREAAGFWSRLDQVSPGTESTQRNLEKCQILAARQNKSPHATRPTPLPVS